jgi:alpha-glucoside transport system substrate-binding protein
MANVLARLSSRLIAIGGILLLVACSTGGGTTTTSGSKDVSQWVAWGGAELAAYRAVLKPFETSTGIKVHLTTNRESNTAIANGIEAGTELPDLAPGPSDPIQLRSWVSKGKLQTMETALGDKFSAYISNTYPALVNAPGGAADDPYIGIIGGKHYMLIVKTQVKGLFWYNKKVFTGSPPKTFDELMAIQPASGAKLFCAAFESGGDSGWPASDMIDNIIMRQSGDKVYTDWIEGKQKWTSPEIKLGYQTFLKEVAADKVYGGNVNALTTPFQRGGKPLLATPPGCMFYEQATFVTAFFKEDYPSLQAGTDFDFFGHPSMGNSQYDGNVNGFYDNIAMYNNTPAASQLMQYLSTAEAQQIWADAGGTLGAIKTLTYKDPVFKRSAEVALSAKNLLITAGDYMPSDMKHAFWKSLLNVTKNPSSLNSELARLDQIQAASYKTS